MKKSRVLSWILSLVMAVSFMPITGMVAFAAEDDVLFTVQYLDQVETVTQGMWNQWMADDDMVTEADYTKASKNILYQNYHKKGITIEDIYCELFDDFSVNKLDGCKFAIDPADYTKGTMDSAEAFFKDGKTYTALAEDGSAIEDENEYTFVKSIVTDEEGGMSASGLFNVGEVNGKYWYTGLFDCNTADKPAFAITSSDSTGFNGGDGSAENPYKVNNASQINKMAEGINGGTLADKCFVLSSDITLDGAWTPAGTEDTPFSGTFDGAGHVIKGLNISTESAYAGLFGNLSGKVENLTVAGSISVSGENDFVGGIAGKLSSGSIDNCISKVDIDAGDAYNVGGITGFVGAVDDYSGSYTTETAEVSNCINYGDVKGQQKVGGIAGENAGTIIACANKGHIQTAYYKKGGTGGIAGRNGNNGKKTDSGLLNGQEAGTISYCYNTGLIDCTTNGKDDGCSWLGGITGFNNDKSSVNNCYNMGTIGEEHALFAAIVGNQEGDVEDNFSVAGLLKSEDDSSYAGKSKQASDMKTAKFVSLLNAGEEYFKRDKSGDVNNGYPKLSGEKAIDEYSLAAGSVTVMENPAYDGSEKTPAVTVKIGDSTLTENEDYILKYSDNTEVGTASVKVQACGKYTGKLSQDFSIVPGKPTINVTAGKKKLTVSVTNDTGANEYQIYYKQAGKKAKYTTSTSVSKTISKLKKKKKYTVMVRAKGSTGYGAWSTTKTVKVK